MNTQDTGNGAPALTLTDNSAQDRFELSIDGNLIGILGYAVDTPGTPAARAGEGAQVAFMHTVIMEDHWNHGLASELVNYAFATARERGWRVRPVCTYVQRFLAKNPDYQGIVADSDA